MTARAASQVEATAGTEEASRRREQRRLYIQQPSIHNNGESSACARAEKRHRDCQSSADYASQIETTAIATASADYGRSNGSERAYASQQREQRRLCKDTTEQRQRPRIHRNDEQRILSIVTAEQHQQPSTSMHGEGESSPDYVSQVEATAATATGPLRAMCLLFPHQHQ